MNVRNAINGTISHYEQDYKEFGLAAQRRYPNEALCRFLGSNGFYSSDNKKNIRILEVGSGSGANLWMLAKEGFDTYGMDASKKSITLAREHLKKDYGVYATIKEGRFEEVPFEDNFFDVIVDVVSLQCIDIETSRVALQEIGRVLKPDGLFFSYRIADGSCNFLNSGGVEEVFIDYATVRNIEDEQMPLHGNGVMSFWSPSLAKMIYEEAGLRIIQLEKDTRTYHNMRERVEYLSITANKSDAALDRSN